MKQTIVIALVCLFSCGSIFAVDGDFGGGDGSESNPYLIEDEMDLIAVNYPSNFKYKSFKLVSDIDLSFWTFTTSVITGELSGWHSVIGDNFIGTFDGNGHTIKNLTIINSKAWNVGLFEGCLGSTIKNLTLENVTIIGGPFNESIGVLVGDAPLSQIINCHVKNCTITGWYKPLSEDTYFIGGVVGNTYSSDIMQCSATNLSLSAPDNSQYSIGGVVGKVGHSSQARYCYSLNCTINGGTYSGGLIGNLTDIGESNNYHTAWVQDSYSHNCTINDCPNAGGLIGQRRQYSSEDAHIHRCYSTSYPVGGYGLIGFNTFNGYDYTTDSFWNTDTSYTLIDCGGYGNVPGITGITTSQMAQQSTFTNWDFVNTWKMDSGGYYTRPTLQNNAEPDYFEISITSGDNGTVSPAGTNWYMEGTELTVEATESFGYTVDKWYVNGTVAQVGGLIYDVGPVLSEMSINVTFKEADETQYCIVTISHGANGDVIPWPGTVARYIERGTELTIIASPYDGYEVDQWQLNGSVYQYGSNTFTLYDTQTNVSSLSVNVTFEPIMYTVHITPGIPVGNGDLRIGAHGLTVPTGYQTVQKGSPLSITTTPDAGYEVYAWQINGILCGHGLTTYEIDSVLGDMTVGVLFKNTVYAEGAGTALNPYQVYNVATLNAVNDEPAAHYIMTNDIDLSGEPDYEDAVIGIDSAAAFLGVFDGNLKKITGLTLTGHNDYLGLFGVISAANGLQGQVKRLTLESVIIDSDASNIGGLCGLNQSGIIEQCRVVSVDIYGDQRVAGLCGYNSNGTIRYSSAEGSVTGSYRVGLLTGNCYLGTIGDCYAIGTLTMESTATSGGGISGDSNQATISNCYASCSINGHGDNLGSFCGWSQNTSYNDCVTNQQTYEALIGATGGGDVGTIAGPGQSQMRTMEYWTLTNWDFLGSDTDGTDDIWRMCRDGVDFPRLWWQFGTGDIACGDGVNLTDFATLSRNWLKDTHEPTFYDNADINGDGIIETEDLLIFVEHWLD